MWITTEAALQVCKTLGGNSPKYRTATGLYKAGRRGGWARKAPDGYHWEFNLQLLRKVLTGPRLTVIDLAKEANVPLYRIYNAMRKLSIPNGSQYGYPSFRKVDYERLLAYLNKGNANGTNRKNA